MNNFFDRYYFDNTVRDYCISFGIILFLLLVNRVISKYLASFIFSGVKRVWRRLDKKAFVDLVVHPLGMFLVVFISLIALYHLKFPAVWNVEVYRFTLRNLFHAAGTATLLLSLTWLLMRLIDFIAVVLEQKANLHEGHGGNQLIIFFKDFFKVIIVIIGIIMILHFVFDYHVGNLLTGLSIVGAAIALSLKESLENLIASFIIFFDKPFMTGDYIKVQNVSGTVEKIGLRSTRIRTDPKTYVTVPNKQMVDSILDNLSQRTQRKGELRLEIDLKTTSQKLEELIAGIKKILSSKEIVNFTVLMEAISGNAFLVNGDYFTPPITQEEFNDIKEQVNLSVLKLIESMDVRIAGADKEIRIISGEKS